MLKRIIRLILFTFLLFSVDRAYSQQDVDFHLNAHLLTGKNILKVKRDFYDPYLWVLAENNEVYRVNSLTLAVDNYTAAFSSYTNLPFMDIAGRSKDTVFIATNSTNVLEYKNGIIQLIGASDGIPGTVNSVGIAGGVSYNPRKSTATLMIATDKGFFFYNSDTGTLTDHEFNTQDANSYSKVYQATYRTQMYRDSSLGTSDYSSPVDTITYQPVAFIPDNMAIDVGFLWEGGNEFGYNINTAETIYESVYGYNPVFTNFF